MKKNYPYLLAILLIAFGLFGWRHYKNAQNQSEKRVTLATMLYILKNYHYSPKPINDEFSRQLFEAFIKKIDPSKRYFLQSDIDFLKNYRDSLDDQIKELRFDFFDASYRLLRKRQKQAENIYKQIIRENLDLTENDTLNLDYDKTPFPRDKKALTKRWKAFVKYGILTEIASQMEARKDSAVKWTAAQYRKKGIETTKKTYDNFFENLDDLEENDYLSIYFNTIAEMFDPHTNYFKPEDRERFDMDMAGSFEGIGARLQKQGPYTKIVELIPGGPAWRSGKIEVGDIILKVRQENQKEPVDAVGMRIDKLVKLIKGPKGTTVYLTLKKLNGKIVEIALVRDKVILQETFAKSLLIKDKGKTYGYILLPKFYHNFNDSNDRNSAKDIKRELEKLEKAGAQGVIIDLRNDGGGSLWDVIKIAGYFIKSGPVVQVRNSSGDVRVLYDRDNHKIVWKKPVIVLVNELSASASEILAAALQDYKRAIIIGGPQTYGKGTVQKFIDLDQVAREKNGKLGSLKWTTQKFYRINGNATQRKGVRADVIIPDRYTYLDIKEKDQPTALPFDSISASDYKVWKGYVNREEVVRQLQRQVDTMRIFKNINLLAQKFAQNSKQKVFPLNKNVFLKKLIQSQEEIERLDSLTKYDNHLHLENIPADTIGKSRDTVFTETRKRWIKNLKKDPYLEQAVHALEMLQTK